MAGDHQDPGYISYKDYVNAKHEFKRTMNNRYPDNERFEKIINKINNESHKWNLKNKTFTTLHNVLANDLAFYGGMKHHYCRFINYWLNKEVQNINNHFDKSYFPIFQKFSDEFSIIKTNKNDQRCNNYIFNLSHKTINIMDILYGLYDEYDKIKSHREDSNYGSCDTFLSWASNHNYAIDKYYENTNLYQKFEEIKKLIDNLKESSSSSCIKSIYLHKPQVVKLREEEEARREAAEKQKRALEEAIREREEAEKRQHEQELKAEKELLQRQANNTVGDTASGEGTFQHTDDRSDLRAPIISELDQNSRRFGYPERSESSRGLLLDNGHTREGQFIYTNEDTRQQGEGVYEQPGTDKTRSGMFGGSSGFPSYITEVFGSVDPVPVVGVSGGMGALFLLFRVLLIQYQLLVYLEEWVPYSYFLGIHHLETSSEEEEDAHIESHVVSMDNS
ncbi:VIR protein [Plasmodium vivax]|uniref:VIR protein n=1 Tax=Plasmodium vivax TaxID=5855 RepID=A0A1G4E3T9_PLAVI|nr:VIR protein [Plasmodium vivax]